MKKILNAKTILLLILLLGLGIRGFFYFQMESWTEVDGRSPILSSDALLEYHQTAQHILEHKETNNSTHVPGYPIFLALLYKLFGIHLWIIPLVQIALDLGTTLLTYLSARLAFRSERIALIAAFLFTTNLLAAFFSNIVFTETFFTFFVALSTYLFLYAMKSNRKLVYLIAGLCMGWTALIKPIFIYLPIVFSVIALFQKGHWKKNIIKSGILLFSFLFVISFLQNYNLKKYGYYAISSVQGYNTLAYNAAILISNVENKNFNQTRAGLMEEVAKNTDEDLTNPFVRSRVYQEAAIPIILKYPLEYFYFHCRGILFMLMCPEVDSVSKVFGINYEKITESDTPTSGSIFERLKFLFFINREGYQLLKALMIRIIFEYSFLLIGLIACLRKKETRLYALFFLLIILYFTNATSIVGSSRFRMPVLPALYILVAPGVAIFFNWLIGKRKTA